LLEVSGGVTLETVAAYATTGADLVSSGSLTNSARVLDIGLDILRSDDISHPDDRARGGA
jgi:nicotinate-nucleotide pyrophosphorylase (carboxylating)